MFMFDQNYFTFLLSHVCVYLLLFLLDLNLSLCTAVHPSTKVFSLSKQFIINTFHFNLLETQYSM